MSALSKVTYISNSVNNTISRRSIVLHYKEIKGNQKRNRKDIILSNGVFDAAFSTLLPGRCLNRITALVCSPVDTFFL